MKIQSRIFIGFLIVVGVGFSSLLYWAFDDIKPQFRKATEEPLVDASRILASFAATTSRHGEVDVTSFRNAFNDACSGLFPRISMDF
jgi:two-component system sensor histidine kinase CreC